MICAYCNSVNTLNYTCVATTIIDIYQIKIFSAPSIFCKDCQKYFFYKSINDVISYIAKQQLYKVENKFDYNDIFAKLEASNSEQ